MPETFSYGRALAESEATNKRAATRDSRSVESMTTDELNVEHATVNNATRAQQIRDELRRRGV
jgi:hypothetical protein